MTGAAAVALAAELGHLAPLRDWPPVAERVEGVLDALRGSGSVSESDVALLRRWSRRWRRLADPLREFYAFVAPRDARADRALLWLLSSDGSAPPEPLRWAARSAYAEWRGDPPALDLLPRLRGASPEDATP